MFLDILLIGIGLSMDAFAVSLCKGLSMRNLNIKKMFVIGFYFGFFQALMPLIGYFLGLSFQTLVVNIDHWIAFMLLGIIGINMIKEAIEGDEDQSDSVSFREMIGLAIATSIDALAVGITFAFFDVNILGAITVIGITTFILSIIAVYVGSKFGNISPKKAQILGGVILILIGLKILLEHLGIL